MLTQARLKELLDYDPLTGIFTHKRNLGKQKPGTVAGCVNNSNGYVVIRVDRVGYSAHRLAFLWMTGKWPSDQVDHINQIRTDNKWSNLRPANQSLNTRNSKPRGASGHKGVEWSKKAGKWLARIKIKNKRIFLGYYDDPAIAGLHYQWAAISYHREFFD